MRAGAFPPNGHLVRELTQSCLILYNPMDCSLPGSSVHGTFQVRVLVWVASSFSRGSSRPRDGSPTLQADALPSELGPLLCFLIELYHNTHNYIVRETGIMAI